MKIKIDKDWCIAAAKREGDSEVGAGILAADPSNKIAERKAFTAGFMAYWGPANMAEYDAMEKIEQEAWSKFIQSEVGIPATKDSLGNTDSIRRTENMHLKSEIDRLRASMENWVIEHEVMRVALEVLTKDPPATLDEPDTDAEVIKKMRLIASRALSFLYPSTDDGTKTPHSA